MTNLDSTPARPFGFGLSYTTFRHDELAVAPTAATADGLTVSVRVTNTGDRSGSDVVQLYGRDVVASVTRPVAQLLGYARVRLEPGESRVVELAVPPARLAFTGRDGVRVVEPGELTVWVGSACDDHEVEAGVALTGPVHAVGDGAVLATGVRLV